jgi:FkbM family methyltransferase
MARNRYSQKDKPAQNLNTDELSETPSAFFENGFCKGKQTRHGFMLYNPNDFLGHTLDKYGDWAYSEIDMLKQLIQPGFVILDVGANIGTHTLSFAQLTGSNGFVYAFEPQRILFEFLCANIVINNHLNVLPMMAGVGEAPGEIIIPLINPFAKTNAGSINIEGHNAGDKVPLITIDSLNLKRCNLLKVDVEGMERKVLLGARETIGRARPLMFVENNTPENSGALIQLLIEMDYKCWWFFSEYKNREDIQGRPFKPGEGFKPDFNLLCIPAEVNMNVTGFQPVLGTDDTGAAAIDRILGRSKPA